jgi:FkbM family methyltransferase
MRQIAKRLISFVRPAEVPYFERVLRDNYRRFLKAGDWIADVGAHDGLHTLEFVKITGNEGRVAAFEPLPRCYRELVSQFKRSNVQIGNFALSHYANPAVAFTEATGTPQESGLKRRNFNHPERANPRQIIVQVSTLDRQIGTWQRLDYLKIDIEGGELDCLEGGEEIVTRCRPVISFECGFDAYEHYGKTSIDFLEYARGHRFAVMDLFGNDVSEQHRWEDAIRRMWDFYFVPTEKIDWLLSKIR